MRRFIHNLTNRYQTDRNFREIVRFCLVGGICTVIDVCIFYTTLLFAPYQVALTSGYCLSLIVNYFLTVYWTFQQKANAKNAVGVVGAHLFNLGVVRMGLMFLFVNLLGIPEQIAFIPTFAISVVTNFIIVRFVVTRFS